LRHLAAASDEGARNAARSLAVEWTIRYGNRAGVAGESVVTARRLVSWLTHASLLLEGADPKTYAALTRSLGSDLVRLSADWRDAPEGYPRLFSLIALLLSDLCVSGHDRQLADTERAFSAELARQILPDGGHVSRNASVLVELLLDLLPLKQCFASRQRTPPAGLAPAMHNMFAMLRTLRLGDGMLALQWRVHRHSRRACHGAGTMSGSGRRSCAKPSGTRVSSAAARSCWWTPARLHRSGRCGARGLSVVRGEFGHRLIFTSAVRQVPPTRWRTAARATASLNTLARRKLVRLIRHTTLSGLISAPHPRSASSNAEGGGGIRLAAEHDGYADRFGLLRKRALALSANGASSR
jgi:uncharacterized heparinase superfamily protein